MLQNPERTLSIDCDGIIYRFFNTNKDGSDTYRWNGSSGDGKNALDSRELNSFSKKTKGQKMIFGQPFEFAVFYEVLEKTEYNNWKFGTFGFFIDDEIYPSKGSNYTLKMAINYLKDSQKEINSCKSVELSLSENASELLTQLAHSHGILIDREPHDLTLPDSEAIGVFLSPVEISDVGFYLFYYHKNNNEECLIYSPDFGRTAKIITFKKGTVNNVLQKLPCQEAI